MVPTLLSTGDAAVWTRWWTGRRDTQLPITEPVDTSLLAGCVAGKVSSPAGGPASTVVTVLSSPGTAAEINSRFN